MTRRLSIFAATVGALMLVAHSASAQADEAMAAAQFEKGLADMEAGRYATGCPALAESFRLDPKAGALFTLAECEAKWGRVASASAHYDDYLKRLDRMTPTQRAMQGERERVAATRLAELRPRVPILTVHLPPAAPDGTVVTKDGVVMGTPSLGVALPVDPGEHVFVVRVAKTGASNETKLTIAEAERKELRLDLPPFTEPTRVELPSSAGPKKETSRSPWVYVAFGGALAGVAVGSVTGILVLDRKATIDAHCLGTACDAEGISAADSAQTLGAVSTVAFAVAAVGLAVGIVLLVAPSKRAPTVATTTMVTW